MPEVKDEGGHYTGQQRGNDGLLDHIQHHQDHQHRQDRGQHRGAGGFSRHFCRGVLPLQFLKVFAAVLGPLDHPHHIGRAKGQLQHRGDHARNCCCGHCGTQVDGGRGVLDGGREGGGHGHAHTAGKRSGREKFAGDVRLAEHGQRVHGKHGHKQVHAVQGQDDTHNNQADDRKAVAKGPENKGGKAVGRAADLHQLSEERAQHKQQEEVPHVVPEVCHIGGSDALIQSHPPGQQQEDG